MEEEGVSLDLLRVCIYVYMLAETKEPTWARRLQEIKMFTNEGDSLFLPVVVLLHHPLSHHHHQQTSSPVRSPLSVSPSKSHTQSRVVAIHQPRVQPSFLCLFSLTLAPSHQPSAFQPTLALSLPTKFPTTPHCQAAAPKAHGINASHTRPALLVSQTKDNLLQISDA